MTMPTLTDREGNEFSIRDDFEALLRAEEVKRDPERHEMAIAFARGVLDLKSTSEQFAERIEAVLEPRKKAPVLRLVQRDPRQ